MSGYFVVALELPVLRAHLDVREVRLPYVRHLISVRANHARRLGVAAVLADDDWVQF